MKTLWGNAFTNKPAQAVINFTAGRDVKKSLPADYSLLPYDILGSKAHCVMLYHQGIILKKDAQKILKGLEEIEKLSLNGEFILDADKEDVHTNIESSLTEKYGIEHAGKLHTARSRNDQSNVDTRLYIRDKVLEYVQSVSYLIDSLIVTSSKYKSYVMPGFTHHQHAMPTTFGHILLAFAAMLQRDTGRFSNWYSLHNTNPLGAAAGYGTSFAINQKLTTQLLGFDMPAINSVDAITNRWEPELDFVFAVTVLMNHLSLMSQTFILFTTPQFGMITLADEYSTGSSIMPQKKNPDPLEVMKGKTSYISGLLQSLQSLGQSNFIGYNRDSQWTKYALMDSIEESSDAPEIMKNIVATMTVHQKCMESWCYKGFIGSATLMEQIVIHYNLPLRKTKIIVELAVKYSKGKDAVSYEALMKACKDEGLSITISKQEVQDYQDPFKIIGLTESIGGPGKKSQHTSRKQLRMSLLKQKKWMNEKIKQKKNAQYLLETKIKEILKN
jgi:argininosuccinate lyase